MAEARYCDMCQMQLAEAAVCPVCIVVVVQPSPEWHEETASATLDYLLPQPKYVRPVSRGTAWFMPSLVILSMFCLMGIMGYGFYLGMVNPSKKPIVRAKSSTQDETQFFPPSIERFEAAPAAERKDGAVANDSHLPKEFDLLDELNRSSFTPLVFPTPKARVAPALMPEAKGKSGPNAKQVVSLQKAGHGDASISKPFLERDDSRQYGRAKQKE